MSEDIFVVSSLGDDEADDSGIGNQSTAGTRSMGGSVGTMRHPESE
jgi:hypothetical protein